MAKKAIAQIELGDGTVLEQYNQLHIVQHLYGHHEFQIQVPVGSIEGGGSLGFKKAKSLVGQTIKIGFASEQIMGMEGQLFNGIITDLAHSRFQGSGNTLIIKGKSPSILLDNGYFCRSFSEKKLADIVEEVLQDYPANTISYKIDPAFTETIPYVVQYRESNYQFLQRLANLYGEWLLFDGSDLIFGNTELPDPIPLKLASDLMSFNLGMSLAPVNFKLHAYDYLNNKVLESEAKDQQVNNLDKVYGEISFGESEKLYTSSAVGLAMIPVKDQGELDKLVAKKREQQASGLVRMKGTSDNVSVGMGRTVTISGASSEDLIDGLEDYGEFIVVRIKHRLENNGNYENQFEALPVEVTVPPLNPSVRTPVSEPQPAVVKENKDPEGLGRIRVQFYWQQGGEMTPWIRLVSTAGGKDGGFFVIPEKGDEVMINFENHYPDKPFVMGSVYHGKAKPGSSYQTDDNFVKAIKTKSGNEIVLNDEGGKEEIKILNKGGENSVILTMSDGGAINISTCNAMSISGKNITISASEDLTVNAKNMIISTEENFQVTAGSNVELTASGDAVVEATNCSVHGSANVELVADAGLSGHGTASAEFTTDGNLDLHATTNANLNGDAGAKVSGMKVDVEGQGPTTIKGSVVQLN